MQPVVFVLAQFANIAQPLRHYTAGSGRDVDANPLTVEDLSGDQCGSATAEGVENNVVLVAAGSDNSIKKRERFLCRVAKSLFGLRVNRGNVRPNRVDRPSLLLVEVTLHSRHSTGAWLDNSSSFIGFLHPLPGPSPNLRVT